MNGSIYQKFESEITRLKSDNNVQGLKNLKKILTKIAKRHEVPELNIDDLD